MGERREGKAGRETGRGERKRERGRHVDLEREGKGRGVVRVKGKKEASEG